MSDEHDLVVVGAGPAGLAAAVQGRALGLDVVVLDEQPAPGGQIWRALEARSTRPEGSHSGEMPAPPLSAAFARRAPTIGRARGSGRSSLALPSMPAGQA